jgi:hypothetical protein
MGRRAISAGRCRYGLSALVTERSAAFEAILRSVVTQQPVEVARR